MTAETPPSAKQRITPDEWFDEHGHSFESAREFTRAVWAAALESVASQLQDHMPATEAGTLPGRATRSTALGEAGNGSPAHTPSSIERISNDEQREIARKFIVQTDAARGNMVLHSATYYALADVLRDALRTPSAIERKMPTIKELHDAIGWCDQNETDVAMSAIAWFIRRTDRTIP